jgi:hypothetical protein
MLRKTVCVNMEAFPKPAGLWEMFLGPVKTGHNSSSNSEFERKNSLGRTSESGHACPCGASVKWLLSDNPPYVSPFWNYRLLRWFFMVKNDETSSAPYEKRPLNGLFHRFSD